MMRTMDFLFEVIGEDSPICGENFFVEVDTDYEDDPRAIAWEIAVEYFPDEKLECLGAFPPSLAEALGYDTY